MVIIRVRTIYIYIYMYMYRERERDTNGNETNDTVGMALMTIVVRIVMPKNTSDT